MSADPRETGHRGRRLLAYEEAVAVLLAAAEDRRPETTRIPLREACGRVLAEDVAMDRAEPPAPRSAMDGFALRSADGAAERRLRGTVYAGTEAFPEVRSGEAVAVMTGGTVPPGADAVVPVEQTRVEDGILRIEAGPAAGQHVRRAGEMGDAGRVLLSPGRRLGPADLGAAAGCGADPVRVTVSPRFAVVSTGDEVVPWDTVPAAHQVRDSNRLGSVLQLERAGGTLALATHLPDEPTALAAGVEEALAAADLVVTIGGVSMGEKDHLPRVFEQLGVRRLFHGVSVQPGKPVWAGERDGRFVLGLPGNPVSSFVILELFGVPLLERLEGGEPAVPRPLEAGVSGCSTRARKRPRFLPADLAVEADGRVLVTARPEAGSGDWTALAGADALLHLPPDSAVAPGDPVRFLRLA